MLAVVQEDSEPAFDLRAIRVVQQHWAATPLCDRLVAVRRLRVALAENSWQLAESAATPNKRPIAEKLMSEVLPLIEACRWLTRAAPRVLATKRFGRWFNPLWLPGHSFEVQRHSLGVILVIGPGNYPLFLPAVQTLHALVAGNAVLLKPAPGMLAVALQFARFVHAAGVNPELLTILSDTTEAAQEAIESGVDKVIFTGSSQNGRAVLALLAEHGTPSVMELSGEDAVVVLADADLGLTIGALRFGNRLNNGDTCIAPRRIIVEEAIADALHARFPGVELERVPNDEGAIAAVNANPFGLGASIFSRDLARAGRLAARLQTGFVTINDLIVPTADPRMPFGGVKASGFGTTRGVEGLLEMTFPHVVAIRRGQSRPHFDEPQPGDAKLFEAYIRARHGRNRIAAWRDLLRAASRRLTPNE